LSDFFTFIAHNRALYFVDCYDDKSPKEALGPAACGVMFRLRTRRVWCHAAVFALSVLVLDCSRKLVGLQSPAACATRVGGDFDPDIENYDPFLARIPDTRRGVHARSWRANRDVDVRRCFLRFCLSVHLLALLLDWPFGEGSFGQVRCAISSCCDWSTRLSRAAALCYF